MDSTMKADKKNNEGTTAVTVAQLPLNSKKANYATSIHAF
jgi:hypothetical protein